LRDRNSREAYHTHEETWRLDSRQPCVRGWFGASGRSS
jgi:hypothetical protein